MRTKLALVSVALAACTSASPVSPPVDAGVDAASPPAWQVLLDAKELDRPVLSVWGSAPGDVYAVGGPRGNSGFQALALRFDGAGWRDLEPGGADTFWWVHGTGPSDVWMVGEMGRVAHWDGRRFVEHARLTKATLFGVWAASATDVWAVGGTPEGGTGADNDVVLHFDGKTWAKSPLPGTQKGRALFKVWGSSAEDVYVVGEHGSIWHRKGGAWALESDPPLAKGTLLTVAGCGKGEVYAVGGRDVLRSDGTTWSRADVEVLNDVSGVACGPSGSVVIVGSGGLKQRLVNGAWKDDFGKEPFTDLHGAWSDGAGAFWAGGGDFLSKPAPGVKRRGVVTRFAPGLAPSRAIR